MLLSMTGFGEFTGQEPGLTVGVEVRSVNNRHLKVSVRGSEPYSGMESEIEKIVRRSVRRGSLLVQIRVDRVENNSSARLDSAVLRDYILSIHTACEAAGTPQLLNPIASGILSLPGIITDRPLLTPLPEREWALVQSTLEQALTRLHSTRTDEGHAMAAELLDHHQHIAGHLEQVRTHLPAVSADYRKRLVERVRQAVAEAGIAVEPQHLMREVAIFADRVDVSEELARFASHLAQFVEVIQGPGEGAGRRLEFIVQEMGREANTLGSKAGDVTISRHAVEIKATLEKIRELIQNIE
ncbi:MAG: YicC family protein [Bacteroidales bacterium]|nr:YicC family protein [Bacteroidales bacterium]